MSVKAFEDILNRFHEKKLAHAFLLETNDSDKCFIDILNLIKNISIGNELDNVSELIDNNNLPSLIIIEPDGQNIRKEQIKDLISRFSTKPVFTDYNFYIVKDADRFNSSSANALLKFLEEPEDDIVGFFITNNRENVISTIRSRCQVFNCNYNEDEKYGIDENILIKVKEYLNGIYNNNNDLLYNRTDGINLFKERRDWEKFFNTMLFYYKDFLEGKRTDSVLFLDNAKRDNVIKALFIVEDVLKRIRSNGNIDLILDKFVIEMRCLYA